MQPDFLQIGFQKCGTTYLEHNVYPTNPNLKCIQAAGHLDLERVLLNQLIIPDGLEYQKEVFTDSFSQVYSGLFDESKKNGIMFEPFTFFYQRRYDRKHVIDRIKELYPDIKIIMFIRSQKSWFLSLYSQYLKSGGLLSLYDFIECQFSNPHLDAHYVDWYPLISYLFEVFGKDQVKVCLFEDLTKSPQEVSDQIFSFLKIPASSINPEKVNISLSQYGLSLRRLLNHFVRFDNGASGYSFPRDIQNANPSLFSKAYHRFVYYLYKPFTNMVCYKMDEVFKLKKKLEFNESQVDKLNSRYGENNQKLSELLNINLGQLGYPLK